MKAYGIPWQDVEIAVKSVSMDKYAGNLELKRLESEDNRRGPRTRFSVRVSNSRGPGGSYKNGRHNPAACFHAIYDVLERLFELFPEARIQTVYRDYYSFNFHAEADSLGNENVGSRYKPLCMADACHCEED